MTVPKVPVEALDTRIRELLAVAKRTFVGSPPFSVSERLSEIRGIIASWQDHLGFERTERKPFWKCVAALNDARPDLELESTLKGLVDRASKIPPGPLVQLFRKSRESSFSDEDKVILESLAKRLDDYPVDFPIKWERYINLFRRVPLTFRDELKAHFGLSPFQKQQRMVDHLSYLEFFHDHRVWKDLYFDSLRSLLFYLVFPLENESFFKMMQRVIEFRAPTIRSMTEYRAMQKAHIRKIIERRRRNLLPELTAEERFRIETEHLDKQIKCWLSGKCRRRPGRPQ